MESSASAPAEARENTADPASAPWRVPGLDGLRAVAILLVIVWHVTVTTNFPPARFGALRPFVFMTWAGVDLFFALSGFLITSLLLREERRNQAIGRAGTFSLRNFYIRRTLRILPVFYVVFALLTLVLSGRPAFRSVNAAEVFARGSPYGLWPYATFWGNYFEANLARFPGTVYPGNAFLVFWSLCVEEHFYLLWPLILRAVRSARLRLAIALAVCASLPILRLSDLDRGAVQPIGMHLMSHYRFDSLLWGAIAAMTLSAPWMREVPRRALLAAVSVALAWSIADGAFSLRPHGTAAGTALGLGGLALASALLVAEFALRPEGRLVRALDRPAVRFIGRLSYAMYLVHFPAIDVAKWVVFQHSRAATWTNYALLIALTTAVAVAAAWALHVTIERPFLRLKDRFGAA